MMRHVPARLLALFAAGLAACSDASAPDTPLVPAAPAALQEDVIDLSGRYLVRFNAGVPAGFAERVAALGGSVIFAHGEAALGAVAGLSPEAASALAGTDGVAGMAPDAVALLEDAPGPPDTAPLAAGIPGGGDPTAAVLYPRQWHLRAVGADRVWAAGRLGSPEVRVAILDSGLDYTHPDLAGRVDLAASRSFMPFDDMMLQRFFPGADPAADLHRHGSHVGSIVSSNGVVNAGVTSRVTLVSVKTCSAFGPCPVIEAVQGLLYAADLGVDVANLSHGMNFKRRDLAAGAGPSLVAVMHRAFAYAHRKGVTVVIAAGNSSIDMDHDGNGIKAYCNVPTVICVSATGPTAAAGVNGPWENVDAVAPYTNYGRSAITVAAPGGTLQAPVTSACSTFSVRVAPCRDPYFPFTLPGTSMAAAMVSGAAALVVEDVGRNPAQVRARLMNTADDLGAPGHDPYYGRGRINLPRALGLE